MHVHLDRGNCLEIALMRGPINQVRSFANAVMAERGVRRQAQHGASGCERDQPCDGGASRAQPSADLTRSPPLHSVREKEKATSLIFVRHGRADFPHDRFTATIAKTPR